MARNPLRESLQAGRFCHVVELVASRIAREARLLEVASQLAVIPGVVAGSVTSYAGGSAGQDPVRVGTAAKARGLTPNIHVTCVSRDRHEMRDVLKDLNAIGIENVFALTGDYPKGQTSVFDMDSVELIALMNELRLHHRMPFWIACAITPFKYTEADCGYQYLKLEKKFAAGADYAITQLGYDVKKFIELQRYLNDHGIQKPILGNVYVLGLKPAQKMAKGEPPGCWVAPELVERIKEEVTAKDSGEAARLERAARMVAILRGLGYAGAYIGGTHKPEHVRWIIERGKVLEPQWEEWAKEFTYAPKNAFYMYDSSKAGESAPVGLLDRFKTTFYRNFLSPTNVHEGSLLDKIAKSVSAWIDRRPGLSHKFERAEFAFKSPAFGCQSCGNCVLPDMEYVCPQTCPKQLRNGPCGGTLLGQCEVIPEQKCIWNKVYDRAKAANELDSLKVFIPAPDRSLKGSSAWVNYFLNKDSRPGHPMDDPAADPPPPVKKEESKDKVTVP